MQEKGNTVIGSTDEFCLLHLDAKYAQLCRNVVGKLARKRPSPLLRGDLRIWASGVFYALASNNFLFDPSQPMHLSAQQLGDLMGVKKTTMANKGTMVRNLLKIGMMDPEFTHPDLMDKNPLVWTLLIDGLPIVAALATLAMSVATLLPDEQFLAWGWRIPFLLSAALVALALVIRTGYCGDQIGHLGVPRGQHRCIMVARRAFLVIQDSVFLLETVVGHPAGAGRVGGGATEVFRLFPGKDIPALGGDGQRG